LLTRTRFVVSWIRAPLLKENKNAAPFSESAREGCVPVEDDSRGLNSCSTPQTSRARGWDNPPGSSAYRIV